MKRDDLAMNATVVDPSGSSGERRGVPDPAAGRIGRFVVLEMLGQGAMGVVFAGYDPDLDRKVAIKLLKPGVDDGSDKSHGAERMLREARAMAKLSHPNVLVVHEVGTIGNEIFIATELATGGTLRQWCAEPRGWRAVLDMFLQAARGLDAAHRAGLVHRDFKPENVLLTGDGKVRVADFGLVGIDDPPPGERDERPITSSSDVTLTRTGTLLGTPAYMAPEQHERRAVGPAADQFALCVSLWEGLHGVRPFGGDSYKELADRVIAGTLDEPPADRDVPAWLRAVIRRGLATRPADRWPSMAALIAALEADPSARAPRRAGVRVALVAGAAALAGLATFAVSRTAGVRDTRCTGMDAPLAEVWSPARSASVRDAFLDTGRGHAAATHERVAGALDGYGRDWVRARIEVCEATHVRGVQSDALLDLRMACLDRRLGELGALVEVLATPATPEVVDRAAIATAKLTPLAGCDDAEALQSAVPPPDDAATRAEVDALRERIARAKALLDAGQFRDALPLAQAIAADAERVGFAPVLADALRLRANLEAIGGDAAASDATLEQAILAAAAARDDRLAAIAWTDRLAVIGDLAMRPDDALKFRTAAEAAVRRAGGPADLEADLAHHLGNVLNRAGRFDEAQPLFTKAVADVEAARGADAPELAKSLMGLAYIAFEQGRIEDAVRYNERVLAIWEKSLGADHPQLAVPLNNLGNAYQRLGRIDEALRTHERVLAVITSTHGDKHPRVADSLDNLANALQAAGRLDESRARRETALALRLEILEPGHYDIGISEQNLGDLMTELDDAAGAAAHYQRALEIWAKIMGADHVDLAYPLTGLAMSYGALGRLEEAKLAGERAVALRTAAGTDPAELGLAQFALAEVLWQLGERARALELARAAHAAFKAYGVGAAAETAQAEAWLAEHSR